jgi:hypothetical protein
MKRRAFLKQVKTGSIALAALPILDALATRARAQVGGHIVRWDLISLDFTTTPFTVRAGGVDNASIDAENKISFTGSGSFTALPSGEPTTAVTGGGTWTTSGPLGGRSGTFQVTELLHWQFANSQTPLGVIDQIAEGGSNGNAVLRIKYSDGSDGILALGCHGPGAPDGILEGVIATKGYLTYWNVESPVGGVDADRTDFHVF